MVSFTHQGEEYIVEPYAVGYDERDERGKPLLLRAWYNNGWRDFEVKFMSTVEIDAKPFSGDRQGYRKMATVLCDVFGKSWRG